MELDFEEIKPFFCGAVRFLEEADFLMPLRFTEAQAARYRLDDAPPTPEHPASMFSKTFASAGIRLDFRTDAETLELDCTTVGGSSRKFCYFDLYLDGVMVQHAGTENREAEPEMLLRQKLGGGNHHVTVYFPNLAGVRVRRLTLTDGAFAEPVKRRGKMLIYGDSITQGYDARYPSLCYANRIADEFDLEAVNKAIGGDTMAPETGNLADDFTPELLFCAYGTNDWHYKTREKFEADTAGFYRNLRQRYPEVPLVCLLPVWRADGGETTAAGSFGSVRQFIAGTVSKHRNVHLIDGMRLLPQLTGVFSDGYLHPNDFGFLLMASGIVRELRSNR